MPKIISIDGVGDVEFPDAMSDADISHAIETDILGPQFGPHTLTTPGSAPRRRGDVIDRLASRGVTSMSTHVPRRNAVEHAFAGATDLRAPTRGERLASLIPEPVSRFVDATASSMKSMLPYTAAARLGPAAPVALSYLLSRDEAPRMGTAIDEAVDAGRHGDYGKMTRRGLQALPIIGGVSEQLEGRGGAGDVAGALGDVVGAVAAEGTVRGASDIASRSIATRVPRRSKAPATDPVNQYLGSGSVVRAAADINAARAIGREGIIADHPHELADALDAAHNIRSAQLETVRSQLPLDHPDVTALDQHVQDLALARELAAKATERQASTATASRGRGVGRAALDLATGHPFRAASGAIESFRVPTRVPLRRLTTSLANHPSLGEAPEAIVARATGRTAPGILPEQGLSGIEDVDAPETATEAASTPSFAADEHGTAIPIDSDLLRSGRYDLRPGSTSAAESLVSGPIPEYPETVQNAAYEMNQRARNAWEREETSWRAAWDAARARERTEAHNQMNERLKGPQVRLLGPRSGPSVQPSSGVQFNADTPLSPSFWRGRMGIAPEGVQSAGVPRRAPDVQVPRRARTGDLSFVGKVTPERTAVLHDATQWLTQRFPQASKLIDFIEITPAENMGGGADAHFEPGMRGIEVSDLLLDDAAVNGADRLKEILTHELTHRAQDELGLHRKAIATTGSVSDLEPAAYARQRRTRYEMKGQIKLPRRVQHLAPPEPPTMPDEFEPGAGTGKPELEAVRRGPQTEWPTDPNARDENDALGMERTGTSAVPKNVAYLLPEKFKNAKRATWQSPISGVIDVDGQPRPGIMAVTGRDLNTSPRDKLWSETPRESDSYTHDILTAREAGDNPEVNAHEIGHVIWNEDASATERASFTGLVRNGVNAAYQAQQRNLPPPPMPKAVIEYWKRFGAANPEQAVAEIFGELNGQFMMNPSAFKASYPAWYGWFQKLHGKEYIQQPAAAGPRLVTNWGRTFDRKQRNPGW